MKKALIIFAKRPTPGRVKTRLTSVLSPEEAAELYHCMLLDTLAKAEGLADPDKFLVYEEAGGAAPYFQEIARGMEVFPQRGNDLGERMKDAFQQAFARGYAAAAIIGTDSPHLPAPFVEAAFDRLADPAIDVAMGPSEDGGYYLVAMKRVHGELFRDIPWSKGEVLEKSLGKAAESGISVTLLPRWHDVDTAEDLQRPELLDAGNGAPRTREFLRSRMKVRE